MYRDDQHVQRICTGICGMPLKWGEPDMCNQCTNLHTTISGDLDSALSPADLQRLKLFKWDAALEQLGVKDADRSRFMFGRWLRERGRIGEMTR